MTHLRGRVVSGYFALFLCVTTHGQLLQNDTIRLKSDCSIDKDCPFTQEVCMKTKTSTGCHCRPKETLQYYERCLDPASDDGSIWTPLIVVSIFGLMVISCCGIAVVVICYLSRRRRTIGRTQCRRASGSTCSPGTSHAHQASSRLPYPTQPINHLPYSVYDPKLSPPPPPYPPPTYSPPTFVHDPKPPPPYYNYQNKTKLSSEHA